jgi:uncharacterized membrane protein YeaQ/YmgE (transglycosylase-associated protein family)
VLRKVPIADLADPLPRLSYGLPEGGALNAPCGRRGAGRGDAHSVSLVVWVRDHRRREWEETTISNESILVILLVGLIAGWLAGKIVSGTGYGLVADLCIGIIGALIGSWLLPQLGIHLGAGIISAIIAATIGAIILLVILRLVNRGGRW